MVLHLEVTHLIVLFRYFLPSKLIKATEWTTNNNREFALHHTQSFTIQTHTNVYTHTRIERHRPPLENVCGNLPNLC